MDKEQIAEKYRDKAYKHDSNMGLKDLILAALDEYANSRKDAAQELSGKIEKKFGEYVDTGEWSLSFKVVYNEYNDWIILARRILPEVKDD